MSENEPLVCSDCGMESTEETQEESMLSGWEDGEFGPRCPGCVAENQATSGSQGIAAVGEALNLEKVREARPLTMEVGILRNADDTIVTQQQIDENNAKVEKARKKVTKKKVKK